MNAALSFVMLERNGVLRCSVSPFVWLYVLCADDAAHSMGDAVERRAMGRPSEARDGQTLV